MSEKLELGYIGNGKSTNRYHLPFVLENDKLSVKKIWRHSDKPSPWEEIEGVEYTLDQNNILNDPEIDVVIITTPPQTHYELAKKALEAGKNVVLEKPVTLNLKEAEELYALAKEKNLMLQAYQNRRFDSDFLTMQKVIESGVLGDIYEVETNFDYYRPETPENAKEYRRQDAFLFTHACHSVDQMISYFGIPKDYRVEAKDLLKRGKMNDYFDIDLYYDGLKVSVRSSYLRARPRSKFIVYGTKGVFEKVTEDRQEADLKKFYMPTNSDFGIDQPEHYGTLTYYDDDGTFHEEKVVSERGDYGRYYEHLYKALKEEEENLVPPEETLKVMEILDTGITEFERNFI